MQEEQWVEVEGYPNYAVSSYGRVMNVNTGEELSLRDNGRGYMRVALSNEGRVRDFYVQQLVAQAFFGAFDAGEQIEWVNGDRSNNQLENLRLKKRSRQMLYDEYGYVEDQSKVRGERVRIVETGQVFRTARDCARHINGNFSAIYKCLRGDRNYHRGYSFEYYREEAEAA
ncbi:HNH endonuclease [Arthrobacter phage GoCrazy]|uniref:HNH endonuclease n=6 Tax=Mudcatvirus TaxID=1982088 RepID=A0A222Z734_9CAUD|nr:HNH endonuclease [Arthrobacter phage Mudcat]YP_010666264.1 HNH endonuclease [Arthrobacter phage Cheesy]YP_010666554.1 HNH endonuclease [Arthrobacter phage Heisenberger]YP_010666654.1 HNH endonuclease [Arthrobacter phage JEGGS]YP_010666755.1 HNH endonuclease [Arthrobacter phage Kardesai]YP_010666950.1 HNH endonuclease [Arthrobacter phage KeaneyLin]QXO13571.1 HNH endonuclease [Arthrobacter phage GoCrazy]UYL87338.1 HNH endonuclease [Arthrobacter phage BenitoAntonio]AMM44439.1 HNH endonuclea